MAPEFGEWLQLLQKTEGRRARLTGVREFDEEGGVT